MSGSIDLLRRLRESAFDGMEYIGRPPVILFWEKHIIPGFSLAEEYFPPRNFELRPWTHKSPAPFALVSPNFPPCSSLLRSAPPPTFCQSSSRTRKHTPQRRHQRQVLRFRLWLFHFSLSKSPGRVLIWMFYTQMSRPANSSASGSGADRKSVV